MTGARTGRWRARGRHGGRALALGLVASVHGGALWAVQNGVLGASARPVEASTAPVLQTALIDTPAPAPPEVAPEPDPPPPDPPPEPEPPPPDPPPEP
ncbi:hypothetical protein, partial [Pararhodospirillum oryzae]|uniref:hypothetical protein n=1 Tax=Pararhodospirillum oryzae TaxID=478448 RepID=UPI001C3F76E8